MRRTSQVSAAGLWIQAVEGGLQGGRVVGGAWRMERQLGRGGQASAWAARRLEDGREGVLKQLHGIEAGPARVRFQREAALLCRLRHPHLVSAFELFEEEDGLFISMPKAPGIELRRLLWTRSREGRAFSLSEVEAFVAMASDALAYCHERAVIHRDLKPDNLVVVVDEGVLRHLTIIDFGVARWLATEASAATTAGRMIGSHRYGSPEQLRGQSVGPAADLFSLAAVTWEMLSLRRAWLRNAEGRPLAWHEGDVQGPNGRLQVVERICAGRWARLAEVDPRLTPLDDFFERAFQLEPQARHPDASAFREAFQSAVGLVEGPTGTWTQVSPRPLEAEDGLTRLSQAEEPTFLATRATEPAASSEPHSETRTRVDGPPPKARREMDGPPSMAQSPKNVLPRRPLPRPGRVPRQGQGPIPPTRAIWRAWARSPWLTLGFLLLALALVGVMTLDEAPSAEASAPRPRAMPR
ncbi:MAG: serine/threonine-protein kinase [Myxococcota bacterium]